MEWNVRLGKYMTAYPVSNGEAIELLPLGTPVGVDFWKSPTIEELAVAQDVSPLTKIETLWGTWPDEADDGFEESIQTLRHLDRFRESDR